MSEENSIDDEVSALFSSTALILLGIVLSSAGTLVERVIVARVFTPAKYGEVTIGLAVMSIGSVISLVGINQGVSRYLSRAESDAERRGIWLTGLVVSAAISLVVTVLFYRYSATIASVLFSDVESLALFRLFILSIPLSALFTVAVAAIRGMEDTKYKLLVKNVFYPVVRISLFVGLVALGWGIAAIGYAYVAATLLSLVVAHACLNRLYAIVGGFDLQPRKLISYSAPLVVTTLLAVLLTRTDTLMLGYFHGSEAAGIYNVAYPLSNSLLMVISAFGYLYFPLTSRLDSDGRRDDVRQIYELTTKWGFFITLPAFLVFTVFPADVIRIFFGGEYTSGATALMILSVGFFTSAAAGRNRETLSAMGHTTEILVVEVTTLAANVVINLALIPAYGVPGAAVASCVSYVYRNFALNAILKYRTGITPISRYTLRTYFVLPVVFLPATYALSQYVSLTAVTLPLFLVVCGILVLATAFFAGCFRPLDTLIIDFFEQKAGIELPYLRNLLESN
ncbi:MULTISPECIES: flippase [Halorussus]|uniref:flippase n=1 Tax=Halorussus TaxID=1070314 RepID=UPI000E20F164|nr:MULTISPECIES: flippase [Halorussus]NHN60556.1 flippase [Halorussus sp. JP-T4]